MRHWRPLDGLRAFAVLVVFAGHVRGTPLPGGFIGVDVFFVLSGFLITGLLLREHATFGSVSLKAFFQRRILRLYPALLLLCVVVLPMAAVSHQYDVHSTTVALASALVYCFNIVSQLHHTAPTMVGNLWSLSVEEQYYVLWAPLAALLLSRVGLGRALGRRLAALVLAAWAVLLATAVVFGSSGLAIAYFQLHGHLIELTLGGLLAWCVLDGVPPVLARVASHPVTPALALAVLLVGARTMARFDGHRMVLVYPALAVASATIICHLVLTNGSWLGRVLSQPALVWLGVRSYAFYLFHTPVLHLVDGYVQRRSVEVLVALPVSLLLAELSWRLVEVPALARKSRYARVPVPA